MQHWRDADDRPWETYSLPHRPVNRDGYDDLRDAIKHAANCIVSQPYPDPLPASGLRSLSRDLSLSLSDLRLA